MADFFKYWYTIEETAEILNNHFNYLKQLNFKVFDTQDVINFYREERIRLALHIQELDNEKPIINLFNQQIVVGSFLYDFFDDEEIKGDIQITSGDSVISLLDDYLYAKGYFSIPVSQTFFDGEKFSISALKIYSEDQIDVTAGDSVDYEFSLNHSFSIAFTAPIEINKKDVIILRGDILDLISMIEDENKNAHIRLEHNSSPKITEGKSEPLQQLTAKDEEIARLKEEIAELKKVQPAGKIQQERISQPQRDLFTLLVMNCYGERQSRNDLFNAINADLRAKGIRTSEVKYSTFDKLIDNEIRINNKSPFPPKQK